MDYNTFFNSNGRIGADSNFFKNYSDVFTSETGIIDAFKTVLGEQYLHTRQKARTPFYSKFISKPLEYGSAWTERVTNRTATYKFNPKATASDALKFYDSSGIEKVFYNNVSYRKSMSSGSDLALHELIMKGNSGNINDILLDGMQKDLQWELESDIGVYTVSNIAKETTVDMADSNAVRNLINDIAIDMKTDGKKYSDLERETEYAENVIVFMSAKDYRSLSNSTAILPSPSELNIDAEIIPVYGELPKPVTTAEFNAGWGESGSSYEGGTPVAVDKPRPKMIICDSRFIEVRPYLYSWKMTTDYNGAGDFTNFHIIGKMAIAYKPWFNAIRVNSA